MDFTLKILKAEKENQVFSPINIAHAFGLLLHGAGGDTEKEIANILGFGKFKTLQQVILILKSVQIGGTTLKPTTSSKIFQFMALFRINWRMCQIY